MSAPTIVDPSACTWCAIARREHGRQFADAVGWHQWAAPSQEQILARMKARRLALTVARVGALPVPIGRPSVGPDRTVAYRDPNRPETLLCRKHGPSYVGMTPVTAEELPDGGICTYGRLSAVECGRDVLADEPTAGGA